MAKRYDAVVVGSGPNGLAAAITLAEAGKSVVVLEANDTIGGGARSAELTEPGFVHDLASAIHPLGIASPFLSRLPLANHGLEWINPPAAVAHPLDNGEAAIVWQDLQRTAAELGPDAQAYRKTYRMLTRRFEDFTEFSMAPLIRFPRHPLLMMWLGAVGAIPAATFARRRFESEAGRAMFAGHVAHSLLPLTYAATTTFGLVLGASAHAVGWPFPKGGAQSLADAMLDYFKDRGGEVITGHRVRTLGDLPPHRVAVFTTGLGQLSEIAGFKGLFGRRSRRFRPGPGAFKVDFALDRPIPWANPDVSAAATVHVGGTLDEIIQSEDQATSGRPPEKPFVLLAQHTLFDSSRAPEGKHTAWAYCHVPNGSPVDMTDRIVDQIERFAPGFQETIIAHASTSPAGLEAQNANLVGGDVAGGSNRGTRVMFRPWLRTNPYATPKPDIFIGSASVAPGAGAHGMSGHLAGVQALQRLSSR